MIVMDGRFAPRLAALSRVTGPALRTVGWIIGGILALLFLAPVTVRGGELDDAREQFAAGKYQECIAAATEAISRRSYGDDWHVVKARAELATGRLDAARNTINEGLQRSTSSVKLRVLAHRAACLQGQMEQARQAIDEIHELASRSPWRYTDAEELMALGEAALIAGADPRMVLEDFFEQARRQDPTCREPWLASGHLALDKHDFALAAEI